jgi:type II secretory pathway pseudopilin PulG
MKCSKCGTDAAADAPFCSTCGGSLQIGGVMPAIPPPPPVARTSAMAITGFVLAFVCGLLGLIFSILGRSECKKSGGAIKGEGLALAGMIVSIAFLSLQVIGILAAVAIPAFLEYGQKAKQPEAELQLRTLQRRIEAYQIEKATLPTGSTGATPASSCCNEPDMKCLPSYEDWDHPIWRQLDFQMTTRHYFRYSYESDGQTFSVKAIGDLDCDDIEITYELSGRIVEGNLRTELIRPTSRD